MNNTVLIAVSTQACFVALVCLDHPIAAGLILVQGITINALLAPFDRKTAPPAKPKRLGGFTEDADVLSGAN